MSRRKKIIVALILMAALGTLSYFSGTLAWFTQEIMSGMSNISSGNLNIRVNGQQQTFNLNFKNERIYPDDYIAIGNNGLTTITTINTGSIDVFYTGGFEFDRNNPLSHGMVIEFLRRRIYNSGGTKVHEEVYINDFRVSQKHQIIRPRIDLYNVNGARINGGDNLISIREWGEFANTMADINRGRFVGALKPGAYEEWSYKIKFHKKCTANPHENRNMGIKYKVISTQFRTEAAQELIKSNGIIKVPSEMSQTDYDYMSGLWINSIGNGLLGKQ